MLELVSFAGTLSLLGPELEDHTKRLAPTSDVAAPHVTVLAKHELQMISGKLPTEPTISRDSFQVLSLGEVKDVRFLTVSWPHAQLFRKGLGLDPKDFHITLSSTDRHDIRKDITTTKGGLPAFMRVFRDLSEEQMDFILAEPVATAWHRELGNEFLIKFPLSYKAMIRYADCGDLDPHLATNAYARALSLNPALHDYATKKLKKLSSQAPCGPFQIDGMEVLPDALLYAWPDEARLAVRGILSDRSTATRVHIRYLAESCFLPRFFSMVLPYRLAVMSTPRDENDIDMLMKIGVTTVLTLTAEEPLKPAWFKFKRISNIFIPVANYGPPTIAEMDYIYSHFCKDEEGFWLVHCGGGKGRAGTVTTCLLAMRGSEDGTPTMDKSSAISLVRRLRPGSIETTQQEDFVALWLSHRWKIAHSASSKLDEPVSSLIIESKDNFRVDSTSVKFIMLVGLPGSGKSHLAESLVRRRPHTIIASQDDSGSRRSCETQVQHRYKDGTLLILDRCNSDPGDRKYWLSLLHSREDAVCVFFDYSDELCLQRIDQRVAHPTIHTGRGQNAVTQMQKSLQKPVLEEGFDAILTVTSHAAAQEAILLLGGVVDITKFPRTTHLINLGAGTPDDLVRSEWEGDLQGHCIVEEKVDGANMGFSLDFDKRLQVQNRSHYVNYTSHAQFKPLRVWLDKHEDIVIRLLDLDPKFPERYILYGEWLAAKHSIHYSHLPDLFLAFDFYDRCTRKFVSRNLLARMLDGTGIRQAPLITSTECLSRTELLGYMSRQSQFYDGAIEGVYIRFENKDHTETIDRGKVVRADFIAGNEHWTKGQLQMNKLQIE